MKSIDLNYICTTIGNLSGIPIRLYKNESLILYHSIVQLPKDPICVYLDDIRTIHSHVGYFVTRHFNYYGIVNSKDYKIIIGPTRQVVNTNQELRELAFRADVPLEEVDNFISSMKNIVGMPLESIMQMLCTVNYILNHEKLELKDITIFDSEQNNLKQALEQQYIKECMSFKDFDSTQTHAVHNTLKLEETLIQLVQKGDTTSLRNWVASAPAVRGGILAKEQLRQLKNTFIVTATLVSRAAIRGGLDVEEAFSLSDSYIQQCELLSNPERIINLQYHMIMEYTERVEKIRLGNAPSKLIIDVTNYVKQHLSEVISTEELAKKLYLSRPYLSSKFKEETGMTLTDYILKEKIEEAKRLLRYSDKAATAISSYLGFSSSSHLSRVFKKYTGMTPTEYREKKC